MEDWNFWSPESAKLMNRRGYPPFEGLIEDRRRVL